MARAAIEVWRIALDAMPALTDCDLESLDAAERARLAGFLNADAARRFALCRLALRHLLAARGAPDGQAAVIALGPHGKPYAPAPGTPRFNLSHATRVALIALSDALELGIDVEPAASFVDTARLQARICSPAERVWLMARHPAAADAAFGRLWARKEALLKTLGTGLALPPAALDLGEVVDAPQGRLALPPGHGDPSQTLWWQDLPPIAGHVGAIAARLPAGADAPDVQLREFDPARLPRARTG